jgi:hypothetical protein
MLIVTCRTVWDDCCVDDACTDELGVLLRNIDSLDGFTLFRLVGDMCR